MAVYKRGKIWWYKFTWNGEPIRESTKQSNKRLAEQMEATHKASLAKGEVGIREKISVPTLKDFAKLDFLPYIESHFQAKPNTLAYYKLGVRNLLEFAHLSSCPIDAITAEKITAFIAKKRETGLEVSSINRQLEVLRRMFKLATEWGKVEKALPRVSMLPGEKRRDRVLSATEQGNYLQSANVIGDGITKAYEHALEGIRAIKRGNEPIKPQDPYLLRDVTTMLLDCGLRPDEAYRLQWKEIRDGGLHIEHGKTENARRVIPLPARVASIVEMRRLGAASEWVFPAPTKSGHIEQSTLKKRHRRACELAEVSYFPMYTLRHTCLTRWAAVMDPYTLAYLAGHSDFATTRRYVHPRSETVLDAMERAQSAQGGHKIGHSQQSEELERAPRSSTIN